MLIAEGLYLILIAKIRLEPTGQRKDVSLQLLLEFTGCFPKTFSI